MTAGKAREAEPETEWTGKVLFAERREKVAGYKIWRGHVSEDAQMWRAHVDHLKL